FSNLPIIFISTSLMSELQRELEEIQQSIPSEVKKDVVSFLYDTKKAGELSFADVHVIGVDGLTHLITLDSRFRPFRDTLFGDKSVDFNRELQTKEVLFPN